jgi:hypothetical protein
MRAVVDAAVANGGRARAGTALDLLLPQVRCTLERGHDVHRALREMSRCGGASLLLPLFRGVA